MEVLSKKQDIPEVTFIKQYPDHPALIRAFVEIGRRYNLKTYDHILFSFHGLPKRHLVKCDPQQQCFSSPNCCQMWGEKNRNCYSAQCYATAREMAHKLGLEPTRYTVTFQYPVGKRSMARAIYKQYNRITC